MIGNDIVDLALARKESNWRRKGFLEKIFTAHEQQLIHTAPDPGRMVWLLWSMKESAYKVAVRNGGKRRFAPTKLACDLTRLDDKNAEGIVQYEEKEYLTKSLLTAQYIATVSTNRNILPDCCTGILPVQAGSPYNSYLHPIRLFYSHSAVSYHHTSFEYIIVPLRAMAYPQQHATLWEKIKQHYAAALSVPGAEVHFLKDRAGAPWMTLPSEEKVPLSVSHHGRFGAFVISSPQPTALKTVGCGLKNHGLETITPYLARQYPVLPAVADHLPELPGLLF